MKVAVTGANGFLGSHIVRYLSKQGIEVCPIVRKGSDVSLIEKYCSKIFHYDDVALLLKSTDVLVHNAGVAKDWGDYREFEKGNVDLVKEVYQQAVAAKIKHIVHISSIAVIGEEDSITPKDETSPYNPQCPYPFEQQIASGMNHYRITKALGEQAAIKIASENQIDLTVLRPAWIYGPREFNAGPYEYCKTVLAHTPLMPGQNHNLFHVVYVEDVARAVFCAIEKHLSGVHVFIIGSKQIVTMKEFYHTFCQELKVKYPIHIPYWLLIVPVMLLEFAALLFKTKKPPVLTRARLYMLYANNVYDVSRANLDLGFEAETDLKYAVRKTIKWWKLNKYL